MKYFSTLLFLIQGMVALAQEDKYHPYISILADYTSIDGFKPRPTIGVSMELPVGDFFGLQNSIAVSHNYVSFSGLPVALPWLLLAISDDDDFSESIPRPRGLFLLTLLESPTVHMPAGKNSNISPYVSFCRVRYMWERERTYQAQWFASFVAGMKFDYKLKDYFSGSIYAEYTQLYYSGHPNGWQAGVSFRIL
jgi:hypothetical protein